MTMILSSTNKSLRLATTTLSLFLSSWLYSLIPPCLAKPGKLGPKIDVDKMFGGNSKIFNGENAVAGDYPWFTTLLARYDGQLFLAGCGGSLIAPGWILTAAHCIFDEFANDPAVFIGVLDLANQTVINGGQYYEIIDVDKIHIHPEYGVGGHPLNNDFALLQLKEDSTIIPVGIDSTEVSENYSTGYGDLHAAGMGVTSPGGTISLELLEVNLQYVSNNDCMGGPGDPYQWPQGYITDSMMCAADNNLNNTLVEGTCQGDSGGPLYDVTSNIVVGIVSWGNGTDTGGALCSDIPEFPTVFARVSDGYDWIQQIMIPTTAPPTVSCTSDEMTVQVSVTTDEYPEDTSWTIESSTGAVVESGTFDSANTTYVSGLCLDKSICHTFTIVDSYGDGIFEPGSFSLTVDESVILSYESYENFDSLSIDFGSCSGPTPTPPTVSIEPTPSPGTTIPIQTPSPSIPPVASPVTGAKKIGSRLTAPGMCLDRRDSDNTFILDECSLSTAYLLVPVADILASVQLLDSNLCMAVTSGIPMSNRDLIFAEPCDDKSNTQKWNFTSTGEIRSGAFPDFCIDDNGSYEEVNMYRCDETLDQYWMEKDLSCDSSSEIQVSVFVRTDSYPEETSWVVNRVSDGVNVTSAGPFNSSYAMYQEHLCLDASECYEFILSDSYGDGMFSGGGVHVTVNGELVFGVTHGNGFDSLNFFFGGCGTKIESHLTAPGLCIDRRDSDNTFILDDCASSAGYLLPAADTLGLVQLLGSNLCLAIAGGTTISNRDLILAETCDAQSIRQKWNFTSMGEIRSGANPAYCLDDNGSYEEVNMYRCDDTLDQYWTWSSTSSITVSPTVSPTVDILLPQSGLTQYFNFDDEGCYSGSGRDIFDLSGQNNHGRLIVHSANSAVFVPRNSSDPAHFYFSDSVGSGIDCSHEKGAQNSFVIWATKSTYSHYFFGSILFTVGNKTEPANAQNGPQLWFGYEKIYWNFRDNSATPFAPYPSDIEDGNYHLFVVTQDGSQASLYYDASLIGSAEYRDPTSTYNIELGSSFLGLNQWNGKIGMWGVYNRALSANEVTDIWNASKGQFGRS